jgi:NAD(P)-dependent dehydrogenase (short-subunit alcohol dehydrogenase family)
VWKANSSNAVGGAQGIGAAAVELLYDIGAHVFFGDWDEKKGRQLEQDLKSRTSKNGGSVSFRQVDVRNHDMQLALFDDAHNAHNRVDVAIQCAGLIEPKGWFEPEDLNLETVRKVCLPSATALQSRVLTHHPPGAGTCQGQHRH